MSEQQGLAGIRLLEVASGIGAAYVGKLFADLGADVVRFETEPDAVRTRPHDVARWLNTNKRSVTSGFDQLVAEADIVVHGFGPTQAAAHGLDYATLRSARAGSAGAGLVLCSISPFGMTGPYADYAAEEVTSIHGASWGFLSPSACPDVELEPLKAPGHHATLMVANVAAAAALAAFDKAERTGMGDHVDFSIFAAAARMTETAIAGATHRETDSSRVGTKTLVPWGIYDCIDGAVQIIIVEQAHWEALIALMGNPEWAELEVFADNAMRRENGDLVDLYLREWLATQTVAGFYHAAQAARICVSPVNTVEQLDRDPHFAARRFFAETPDGLRLPGAGFQIDKPWWGLRRSAPALGEHDGEGWLERNPTPAADQGADPASDASTARPLDGIRVCDFTWVWAGPYCTQYLAHLGADVIRLESPEHLCLFRRLPFNPADIALTPDSAGVFHTYNQDKRSLRIDLRHAGSKEIIRRLVAESDVVIDNFAVGTMASLGFGVDELRAINPDVIVVSVTGYGQTGPNATYMAYGPAGGAVSGLYASNGYQGGSPLETGIAVGDPGTGITTLWSVVAAIAARRRTGEVARVDVAMVEAIAATLGEMWMEYQTDGKVPPLRGNRDVAMAPHGCYPALGEDAWVTIACPTEQAWSALAATIDPALADDARFATMAIRKVNEAALDEVVGGWVATLDRWEVARRLQAVGVAAFPSLSPIDLWAGDPHLAAIGMLERPDHPVVGRRVVPGVPWRLSNAPNGLRRPAPTLGQHTEEVLTELLGYSAEEVAELTASGALP